MATQVFKASEPMTARRVHICTRCGKVYKSQDSFFVRSGSQLYRNNNGYTTVCLECIDNMNEDYIAASEDIPEAAEHVCQKLDLYWNAERFQKTKASSTRSQFMAYIAKMLPSGDYQKSYDDNINERRLASESVDDVAEEEDVVPEDTVAFWGDGFSPKQYYELERTYRRWTDGRELTDADEIGLYRQIAMTDWQITQAAASGNSTERLSQAMNGLLGKTKISAKYSPSDGGKTVGEKIRDWETERPVPEASPEFRDVDGIVRYVTTWFMGHFCKMFGIKNSYNKLYEEAMEKYKVNRPEYVDSDDDESIFESIFGGKRGGDV